jgi:hypothetical protein
MMRRLSLCEVIAKTPGYERLKHRPRAMGREGEE